MQKIIKLNLPTIIKAVIIILAILFIIVEPHTVKVQLNNILKLKKI